MQTTKIAFIIFLAFVVAQSCRLKDKMWDVNVLSPVAYANLSMSNFVNDSTIKEQADKSLIYVREQQLATLDFGEILDIPGTVIEKSVTLKTINLGKREIKQDISLGTIAKTAGIAGFLIISNNGNTMVLPPVNNIASGPIDISAESLFESATFIDGKMEMKITNELPVPLTDIDFELRNKNSGAVIITDFIPRIDAGATFTKVYSLAGKTVEGALIAEVLNMNTPGSNGNPVLIDTSDALKVRMLAYDMSLHHGTAIFPAQNLVNDSSFVYYDLGDARLKTMRIKSGEMKINSFHNIDADMFLHYELPGAEKNGKFISIDDTLPAAKGGPSKITKIYPLEGYTIDLWDEKTDSFNAFFNTLLLRIDSTGEMKYLSLSDSIHFDYGLYDIVPEYAQGYLGKIAYETGFQTITGNFANLFEGSSIKLEDLKMSLDILNGIGAEGVVKLKSLRAANAKTGAIKALSGSILNTELKIAPATDMPFKETLTTVKLDKSNSNISELIEIMPNSFSYEMEVVLNPNGNTSGYKDFIYYDSKVSASLNIEMPLYLSATGIVLQDTLVIEKVEAKPRNPKASTADLKDVIVSLNVKNHFPIEAIVQLYAMNENYEIVDSVMTPGENIFHAGNIDGSTGKVMIPTEETVQFALSKTQWDRISDQKYLLLNVRLSTIPNDKSVKIYSSYMIDLKVSANANLRATVKSSTL